MDNTITVRKTWRYAKNVGQRNLQRGKDAKHVCYSGYFLAYFSCISCSFGNVMGSIRNPNMQRVLQDYITFHEPLLVDLAKQVVDCNYF